MKPVRKDRYFYKLELDDISDESSRVRPVLATPKGTNSRACTKDRMYILKIDFPQVFMLAWICRR